jgi:hypothetical protein
MTTTQMKWQCSTSWEIQVSFAADIKKFVNLDFTTTITNFRFQEF